jgi:hypothetical protein
MAKQVETCCATGELNTDVRALKMLKSCKLNLKPLVWVARETTVNTWIQSGHNATGCYNNQCHCNL